MSIWTTDNPFKKYVQNGRGIGLKVVVWISLLVGLLTGICSVMIIKSLLQEQIDTFVETLPIVKIEKGKIIEPIYHNEVWIIPDLDGNQQKDLRIIADTAVDSVDYIPQDTDIYLTAKKIYLSNKFEKGIIDIPSDLSIVVTHDVVKQFLNKVLWFSGISVGLLLFVLSILFFLLGLVPVMLFGRLINRSLTMDMWGRAFAWPWVIVWNISIVAGVLGIFNITLTYVFVIPMLLTWIFGAPMKDPQVTNS